MSCAVLRNLCHCLPLKIQYLLQSRDPGLGLQAFNIIWCHWTVDNCAKPVDLFGGCVCWGWHRQRSATGIVNTFYLYITMLSSSFVKQKNTSNFPNIGSKAFSEHWQILDYAHAASPKSPKCGGVLCGWSNSGRAPTRSSEAAGVLSKISRRVKLCQQQCNSGAKT